MKRKVLLMMGVLAGVSFAAQGWAEPVTYIAEGSLGSYSSSNGLGFFPFSTGDEFTISYTFDDASDLNGDDKVSQYTLTGFSFLITSGDNVYSTNILLNGSVSHYDQNLVNDYFEISANSGSFDGSTIGLNRAILNMMDADNAVLDDPVGAFSNLVTINDFESQYYEISFEIGTPGSADYKYLNYNGNSAITSFRVVREDGGDPTNPVPEPATVLLFGAGLAGLAAAGRRRRL